MFIKKRRSYISIIYKRSIMTRIDMTSKNPMKQGKTSLHMTFNISQIKEDMLKQNGGKLTEKMEKQMNALEEMTSKLDLTEKELKMQKLSNHFPAPLFP